MDTAKSSRKLRMRGQTMKKIKYKDTNEGGNKYENTRDFKGERQMEES